MEVPVLVLDLNDEEADKLLALHDPLTAMAETDSAALSRLLEQVQTENDAIQRTLNELAEKMATPILESVDAAGEEISIPTLYQVVAECPDEDGQRTLYERLKADGYNCRLLNL